MDRRPMQGRILVPLCLAVLAIVPAIAGNNVVMSPVLPEVNRHLAEGQADVVSNTMPLARAHAQLVLLGKDVHIGVLFQSVPTAEHQKCLDALDSAMNEWDAVLGGSINLVRAKDGENTNIFVRFRPKVSMHGQDVAGYVNWKRSINTPTGGDPKGNFYADLQIRSKDLEGNPMPEAAMRHAAMHELGHVLGLDDSEHQGDVMGPLDIENPVYAPSDLEVQTVKSLRTQAQDIIDASNATVVKK